MQSSYYTCADKRCVSLVLPGLLAGEAVGTTSIETPYLCRYLTHATGSQESTNSLESSVLKWFNGVDEPAGNCAALTGYRLDIGSTEDVGQVLRADPVYQQMDINHAVLGDQSVLDLSLAEARALIEAINLHFEADGLVFYAAAATRWYCTFQNPLIVHTSPLSKAVGRDVSQKSPTGADAKTWRGWLAEIEMLLYSHPVNQERQQNGKVPVNSLWLWGEGIPGEKTVGPIDSARVFADNFYTASISAHFGLEPGALDKFGTQKKEQGLAALVVDDRLRQAAVTADAELREAALIEIEEKIFEPLWRQLGRGAWTSARMWVGGDRWMQLDQRARYRFWRRPKSLSDFVNSEAITSDR